MHLATELIIALMATPQAAAPSDMEIQSVLDFVRKGGPVMIPIAVCSLIALTVVIERLITLRRRNVIPPGLVKGIKDALKSGNQAKALEVCKAQPSAAASIFAAGIRRLGEPVDVIEKHIQDAGERAAIKLRKYLRVLALIGSIATLLGLLGTITGMITAFQTVAASAEALGRTELLARGIYEAMITTAAGLVVAIPVQVFYHWISAKIDSLVVDMDEMAAEFIEQFGRPQLAMRQPHGNGQTIEQAPHPIRLEAVASTGA